MREVGTFEAKNKLSELLNQVERGEEITITRRGKAIAKLVPPGTGPDRKRGIAAAQRIVALRKGVTLGDGVTLKELIEEGRH